MSETQRLFSCCLVVVLALNTLVFAAQKPRTCYNAAQERCFGAVGSNCDGVQFIAPALPSKRGEFAMWLSVGSILHDNCCVVARANNRRAQACYELNTSILNRDDNTLCAAEWRKAVNNALEGKMWLKIYKPYTPSYPYDVIGCETVSRKAYVSAHEKRSWIRWGGVETDFSTGICAPPNTKMDGGDREFCCSKRFTKHDVALSGTGVCA